MPGWWFAFTRDLRRERSFTIDDMPLEAGPYGGLPKSTLDREEYDPERGSWRALAPGNPGRDNR